MQYFPRGTSRGGFTWQCEYRTQRSAPQYGEERRQTIAAHDRGYAGGWERMGRRRELRYGGQYGRMDRRSRRDVRRRVLRAIKKRRLRFGRQSASLRLFRLFDRRALL